MKRFLPVLLALALASPVANAARNDPRFADTYIEADTDSPRVCFQFTQPLDQSGAVRYGDYVRFEPAVAAEFTASGNRLCASGLEHGQLYATTLLNGLPGRDGGKLAKTQQFNVAIPDRQPTLSFSGSSYILPSRGNRQLPLDAVNVAAADVTVLRINDRNLINEINQGRISTLLSRWSASSIESLTGETVWQGVIDIDMKKNRTVSTAVPVGEILGEPEPGIYVIMAVPKEERQGYISSEATQWMVVTDIGVTTHSGDDGMRVFLRSLQDAAPMAGLDVRLIARNNDILGSVKTGADGMARFDPGLLRGNGGARPGAVMAFGDDGAFSFLDLTRPAFDLTDRGVGGRSAAGPIDAFVYTDRGVYRPGETVNLIAMLRDDGAVALAGMPITLRVRRPDGTIQDNIAIKEGDRQGGYHLSLPLAGSARTGSWTVEALVDVKAPPVGWASFQVEDFVPERMEVALAATTPYLKPGAEAAVDVTARFLYGAPGADLTVDGEIVLQQDMNPYPTHQGYKFGLVQEEWRPRRQALEPLKTDAEGKARIPVALEEAPDSTRPLRAMVRVSVAETGGRAVSRTVVLPVRATPRMIGIKPSFDGAWVGQDQKTDFDIMALNAEGDPAAATGLRYELFEETWRYRWYTRDGSWNYRILIDEATVDSGTLDIAAASPSRLEFTRSWGRYRLEINDPETGAATSVRFRVGWFSSGVSADVPDKLDVALDKDSYRVGDVAKVHIRPPFAGQVLLTVAGAKTYETRNIDVPREGLVVDLPVKAEWDAGAYVTATLYRAATGDAEGRPARAIGVAWLARDYSDRTLDIAIDTPERILPRRKLDVGIKVDGLAGGDAYVTLAAVDEGILQLTGFESPSPQGWYFGKRRLATLFRDSYGHLIESTDGAPARIRQGGDEAAAGRHLGGLDASSIKTVSLFSGIVRLGKDGRAIIPLDIPDFNGRLRLMAVAWSKSSVGSAQSAIVVRDPMVSQVTLPRFLAPGDESRITVSLHNLDGPEGKYTVLFEGDGAVKAKGNNKQRLTFAGDERRVLTYTLVGDETGVGALSLSIEGPGGLKLKRDWQIAVRPAQAVITRQISRRIEPGKQQTLTADLLEEFLPGTGEALVTLSSRPEMDLAGLLKSLDRYPYGCVEQTTSRALPLLYVSDVAAQLGIAEDALALRAKVQTAVRRVLTMQRSEGSFGLWNPNSEREEWLTAYVMDFLTQAKELGYPVPEYPYQRGMDWLAASVRVADYNAANLPARIYALYVLARAGEAKASDLRYVHDVYLNAIPTAMARAQLGAALALSGERQRAQSAFKAATRSYDRRQSFWSRWWYYDYGTSLRDMAGTVYLAAYSKIESDDWGDTVKNLVENAEKSQYLSTQERAWLLLAARELGDVEPITVDVGGAAMTADKRPIYLRYDRDSMRGRGVKVLNTGDKPVWQGITLTGVPRDELKQERKGFNIIRAFYTPDGKQADLKNIRQGDTLVAVINGEATTKLEHQAMIVDLLPAGFELENARLEGGRNTDELRWLPELTRTRNTELRDDRYVAALAVDGRSRREFSLAYMVRAVLPGTFKLPAVYVEDMYQPTYYARSRMGTVTIRPAE